MYSNQKQLDTVEVRYKACETKIRSAIGEKNAESRQKIRILKKSKKLSGFSANCQFFLTGFVKKRRIPSEFWPNIRHRLRKKMPNPVRGWQLSDVWRDSTKTRESRQIWLILVSHAFIMRLKRPKKIRKKSRSVLKVFLLKGPKIFLTISRFDCIYRVPEKSCKKCLVLLIFFLGD